MVTKEKKEESVQVVVRVRPLSETEVKGGKLYTKITWAMQLKEKSLIHRKWVKIYPAFSLSICNFAFND